MSGPAINNPSIRNLLPANANNGQVPIWNATTLRWEAGSNGDFDPTANYTPTGLWNFTQMPQVSGVPVATIADLIAGLDTKAPIASYLKLGAPLDATLRSVLDYANLTSRLQLSTTQVGIVANNGFSQKWYNSAGTANARSVFVYQVGNSWSLFSRNDANDGGEEFLNMTSSGPNVTSLSLGKSASPLILSTQLATLASSNLVIGATTSAERLKVRGDGTNAIARFEIIAGLSGLVINGINGALQLGSSIQNIISSHDGSSTSISGFGLFFGTAATNQNLYDFLFSNAGRTNTTGISGGISILSPFGAAAGSANHRPLNIAYTINNSGVQTGTATGINLDATETNLNGMLHDLMNLKVGGVSRFRVDRFGSLTSSVITGTAILATTQFNIGGTGAGSPMIINSGATMQVRTGDNLNFTKIQGKLMSDEAYTVSAIEACTGYMVLTANDGQRYKVLSSGLA